MPRKTSNRKKSFNRKRRSKKRRIIKRGGFPNFGSLYKAKQDKDSKKKKQIARSKSRRSSMRKEYFYGWSPFKSNTIVNRNNDEDIYQHRAKQFLRTKQKSNFEQKKMSNSDSKSNIGNDPLYNNRAKKFLKT